MVEPVIGGLALYYQDEGRYPPHLEDLVSSYLDALPGEPDGYPLEYRPADEGASYTLSFRYVGPGMNVCTYRPEDGWHCYGYY